MRVNWRAGGWAAATAAAAVAITGVFALGGPTTASGAESIASTSPEATAPTTSQPELDPTTLTGPDDYIVMVESQSTEQVAAKAEAIGGTVTQEYSTALSGFAATLDPKEVSSLLDDERVIAIEPDQPISIADVTSTSAPPWGLDRIDQTTPSLDGLFLPAGTGSGVTVYVIDTGVRGSHQDLSPRVRSGWDFYSGDSDASDCNGHGTHVAATIAGTRFGVATSASIVALRVLGCDGSGYVSDAIAAIDWAISDHTTGPAVMNMSLGSASSSLFNAAVRRAVADGISVVVAAGNSARDACLYSPSGEPDAITVAATDRSDALAYFSNTGSCVDLAAPGVGIESAWYTSDTATSTISGTSMAAPHAAGGAAVYLGLNPTATPADVDTALKTYSAQRVVGGTPDPSYPMVKVRSFSPATPSASASSSSATPSASSSLENLAPTLTPTLSPTSPAPSPSSTSPAPSPSTTTGPAPGSGGGGGSSGGGSSGGDTGGGGGALQAITEVRPAVGPLSGGNQVSIIGYGFTGATRVEIGGKSVPFTVVNDATVNVTMPPGDRVGSADVAVVLTPARGRAFAPGGYVYQENVVVPVAPTEPGQVGILSPAAGPVTGASTLAAQIALTGRVTYSQSPNGLLTVRVTVPTSAAGRAALLIRKGKVVARTMVPTTGIVTFRGRALTPGSYRMSLTDGKRTTTVTTPIVLRAATRAR